MYYSIVLYIIIRYIMKKLLVPILIIWALIWFVITWLYISLEIYDMTYLKDGAYKILHFREKFIELALIVWMFAFWFCLGTCFFGCKDNEEDNLHGFEPQKWGRDNLQLVEWIGPKISEVLYEWGIKNFKDLNNASVSDVKKILEKWWKKFALANPKTWPEQTWLAHAGKWKELKEYQDFLQGGV